MHEANLTPLTIVKAKRPMVRGPSTTPPMSVDGRHVWPHHVIQMLGRFSVLLLTTFRNKTKASALGLCANPLIEVWVITQAEPSNP